MQSLALERKTRVAAGATRRNAEGSQNLSPRTLARIVKRPAQKYVFVYYTAHESCP
jgi:hypothetical protein